MSATQKSNQHNRSHKPSENPLGKRSAGNPHAAFDEAEVGNVMKRETELATAEFVVRLITSIQSARQLSTLLTRNDLLDVKNLPKEFDDDNLKKALTVLNVMNFSPEEREAYEDHLKWLRIEANTLKKSEAKGEEKKAMAMAKKMLEDSEPIEKIIKYTELSKEQIESLKSL